MISKFKFYNFLILLPPFSFISMSGVFKELKRIEPDYSFSKRDRLEHRAFLLVGMNNIEPRITPVIEHW